ncbi:T9SS type A sorting domain-containing protein [Rhodohalobacter sp. 8-1]|uniref:T9SS type A sorting domain-containing protein n=1 Tax=Rhodohalobacter sp. 8-1 TaxID=3131972 RepID=UPI0030EEB82B
MKTIKPPILQFHLILILILIMASTQARSQTVGIQADLSAAELISGEDVTLTFSTDTPSDIYFFSAEIEYDPDQLEFLTASPAGAMLPDGEIIFNSISPGVYGISVTRTDPLAALTADDLLQVTFTVNQYPVAGEGEISYSNINFADSQGMGIDFTTPADAEYTVKKTVVDLNIRTPGAITVTEGESFEATGEIFATGITFDDENTDTLNVWVGVNEDNSDPSTWGPEKWELMTFVEQSDTDYFTYSGEIAFQRPVGTYYIALRSEIVNSNEYSFGGIGGFWDASTNPSATLDIQQQGQYQYTVAEWTFNNDLYIPDRATYPNQTNQLELNGASINGFTSSAANSNGWDQFTEGANYWQVMINTEGLEDLKLSSDQSGGSSTGPRDFQVQHSTDGTSWTNLAGGTIIVDSIGQESINQLPLPASLEDEPAVYIRWLQTSDVRVDGKTDNDISSGGTSRIDDILITGQAITPTRVDVWPGDANNDDTVNEQDVLELATYWLSEGPPAIYPSIQFEAREVEEWIPAIVTPVDANGDGRVDQNDLQPIGLHFDDSVPALKMAENQLAPLANLEIKPLKAGQATDIYVTANEPVDISGIAFRADIQGLDDEYWSITEVTPFDWGEEWEQENRLLQFKKHKEGIFAAAVVHKGAVEPKTSLNLVRLRVHAEQAWQHSGTVRLLRGSVTANGQTSDLNDVELTSETAVSVEPAVNEHPVRTELLSNYPNPFNPVTTIPFTLSEPGAAQIEVFDAIGRKVASVTYDTRPAGSYIYQFDASALSSGLYLYRLKANGVVQTRKMLLLK